MGEVLMGVITREESERIRTRLSLPLREYLPHADCHQALDSLENLRTRLESTEAARRDAQESRFALIIENEELGADLAATRARLESAEAALAAVHAHLRSGHLQCAYIGISPRLCSCGDCGALAAALGAAGEDKPCPE